MAFDGEHQSDLDTTDDKEESTTQRVNNRRVALGDFYLVELELRNNICSNSESWC